MWKIKQRWVKCWQTVTSAPFLIGAVGVALILLIFVLAIRPPRYQLKLNMVPTATIAATRDVVDQIGTRELQEKAANAVQPTYRFQDGMTEQVLQDFEDIYAQLWTIWQYAATLERSSSLRNYSSEELEYAQSLLTLVPLQRYQLIGLMNSSREDMENFYSLMYTALENTMAGHVTEGQEKTAVNGILQIVSYRMSFNLSQYIAPGVLNACVKANMLIDQEATETARVKARAEVEPVLYRQGQNIVVKGEGTVNQNQLEMLSTLGLLDDDQMDWSIYEGATIMVLLVLIVLLWFQRKPDTSLISHSTWVVLVLLVVCVTLLFCIAARVLNIWLSPTLLCALLTTALLGIQPGLICNVAMSLLIACLAAGGSESYSGTAVFLLVSSLLSGTVAVLILGRRINRLREIRAGVIACVIEFATVMALGMMTAGEMSGIVVHALYRAGSCFIAVLLCVSIQPILESAFNLPTTIRLMELSNPAQPLLRRLLLEAPGTYYHSIIVANLAEAAAQAVDANPLLARVGGYYHDVGKLIRPSCFKENQQPGENKLVEMDPSVAAAVIIAHPRDGVTIGQQYRLPQAVLNIIADHHGDTLVQYFYQKALQLANGEAIDMQSFRYGEHPPKTKEGAIVLLCDTIEAAVRSMKNPTPQGIEELIIKLVRGKLEDGQLSDSPLTLRDIDAICGAATTVLTGVFHERIEYPEAVGGNQRILSKKAEELPVEPAAEEKQEAQELPVVEVTDTAEVKFVEVEPVNMVKPLVLDDLMPVEPLPVREDEPPEEKQ